MQMRNLAFRGLRLPRLGAMMQSGGFSPADVFSGGAVYFVGTYGEEALDDLNNSLNPIVNEDYPAVMENY